MTVNKKNGKTSGTPSAAHTGADMSSVPLYSPLDLDMEELSGSLLVEEPPGRGALIVTRPPSPQEPFAPASSYPPSYAQHLPTPRPPPKHEAAARPSESYDTPVDPHVATTENLSTESLPTENLPTVDLGELATTYVQLTAQPLPVAQSLDPPPSRHLPAAAPLQGDVELTTLPRGMRSPLLAGIQARLRNALRHVPSRDFLLARRRAATFFAIAVAGLGVGIALAMVLFSAFRGHAETTQAPPVATGAVSSTTLSALPPGPSRSPSPPPIPAICTRTGEPHVIAPNAMVAAGIEIRAFGDDVALGFAPNDHQAMLVRLDPATLSISESTVAASADPVRRVTPIPGKKGRLGLAVDVDRKGDPLRGRRTLPVDPPIQVGSAASHLAWAPLNRGVAGKLWPLDRDETVEALRGARSESNLSTVAIAFRHAGAVWVGTAEGSGALVPKGGLSRIGGLGPIVGFPAIAVNEGIGLMAWADRASSNEPWQLRWVRFRVGEAPGEPSVFKPTAGNGEQAMSPGLTVVPGGRFLLTWTQGPASIHEVRALTLSGDGAPLGAPMSISNVGANAGQGQAAVTATGHGLVAFLESGAHGFQVVVAPIACAP